ncbi:unnamed protein product, partial [Rotaria sp. Silwood2]
ISSLLSTSVAKELKKMEIKIHSLKIIDQQTAQLNSNYIQLNSQFCRTVIDFLLAQPLAYHDYEQDEKIPQAKHKQLEMYLYGLENNNNQIKQADLLIYELFNKCVHILKDNIEKQETDLQNLSVNLIIDCTKKQIRLFHERLKTTCTLSVNDNLAPLPWQFLLALCNLGDSVRILPNA